MNNKLQIEFKILASSQLQLSWNKWTHLLMGQVGLAQGHLLVRVVELLGGGGGQVVLLPVVPAIIKIF